MKLSIITPVYNRADCILRCMESVAKQVGEMEHWIVDDGSTDNTAQIIECFSHEHSHVNFHHFEQNRGVNAARNYAIMHCTGDFILGLDSDDELFDNAIAHIIDVINMNPQYVHFLFAIDSRDLYDQDELSPKNIITYKDWIKRKIDGDFAHVIKREIMLKYPFNEKLRIYEDITFFKFYKHSRVQFFSSQNIMHIEKGRNDSVSLDYLLLKRKSIHDQSMALREKLDCFYDDYISYDEQIYINKIISKYCYLALADENYKGYDEITSIRKSNILLKIIRYMRFGIVLRWSIIAYSTIKNRR